MALSPSLCDGVELNECSFERASQRLDVSLPIWGHGDWRLQMVDAKGKRLSKLLCWQNTEKGLDLLWEKV